MRKFSIILSVVCCLGTSAQTAYDGILKQIEENSPTLAALRDHTTAAKIANRTGINPENPEVEFAYQWGNEVVGINKKNVSVKQSLDFPTVYSNRSKLANALNAGEDINYMVARTELLGQAKQLCIDLTYQNALRALYQRQLDNAKAISAAMTKMELAGEANALDINKAQLNLATMQNEVNAIDIERNRLIAELVKMNGGKAIACDVATFDLCPIPSDFENWYAEVREKCPEAMYIRQQVAIKERELKLTKAEGLPKFSIGYTGEFVGQEKFQGVAVGMSIPLWANRNKVKRAKAEIAAIKSTEFDIENEHYNNLKSLYNQAIVLQANVNTLASSLVQNSSEELLLKAYNSKELPLLNYLLEMEYLISTQEKLLRTQRELAATYAKLTEHLL